LIFDTNLALIGEIQSDILFITLPRLNRIGSSKERPVRNFAPLSA
jgi:hypothetical protein